MLGFDLYELNGWGFGLAIGNSTQKLRKVYATLMFWKWSISLCGPKSDEVEIEDDSL